MIKLIIEIKFNEKKLNEKCDINKTCFIYFHTGIDCDYLTSYHFIKSIEELFKINVNFIDISYFYKGFQKTNQNNQFIKFKDNDINEVIQKIKDMYLTSINNYLIKELKADELINASKNKMFEMIK